MEDSTYKPHETNYGEAVTAVAEMPRKRERVLPKILEPPYEPEDLRKLERVCIMETGELMDAKDFRDIRPE